MCCYVKGAPYFGREPGITSWSIGLLAVLYFIRLPHTMIIGRRVAPSVWKTDYVRLTLTYDLKQCSNCQDFYSKIEISIVWRERTK